MERGVDAKSAKSAMIGRGRRPQGDPTKLVQHSFGVWIAGTPCDQFYDLRDAIAAAQFVKRDNPKLAVVVSDFRTRKLMVEIEV